MRGRGDRCVGLELSFKDAGPVLRAFLIELVFPFFFCLFTILAVVATLVATGAIARFDVVVELPLGFRGNFVAINDGFEVRTLQAIPEFSRLLVSWTTCQVRLGRLLGIGRGFRVRACVGVFIGGVFGLVPFLFVGFRVREIQEVGDGSFNPTEVGRV